MSGKREFGDYQTPVTFCNTVCNFLKDQRGISPTVIIEPTCGIGHFLESSLIFNANTIYGIEINPVYCQICNSNITDKRVKVINSDFFKQKLPSISAKENLLIIGNPPWVTNSTLSSMGSDNLPVKENFKGLKGMDALTGASNFDICEYIILRLINKYKNQNATIAMLCKTSVARNVFVELKRNDTSFSQFEIFEFDAAKVFGISASACLLLIDLSKSNCTPSTCDAFDLDKTTNIKYSFGFVNGQFYSNLLRDTDDFNGNCCFEWRQGVKHDCAKVMELVLENEELINGMKEPVRIENDLVFPLVKSSMFKKAIISKFSKYVIVTQRKAREETAHLEQELPHTWEYLKANLELFDARRSSIYRGAPPFSMFGVGDYSYAQYKVGVSGFYKQPLFSVLYSADGKPVMTDDTSYFICFDTFNAAYLAMLYLNCDRVQSFLKSITFLDAKRPYTKKVLERLDFSKIYKEISLKELQRTEQRLGLESFATSQMIDDFAFVTEMKQYKLV